MIDTHAHLNFKAFKDDSAEVIRRSFSGGMRAIVIPSSNYTTSERAITIATKHDSCYAAVSLHPIHVHPVKSREAGVAKPQFNRVKKEVFDKQKYSALVSKNKEVVKAIGETGIDFFHNPLSLSSRDPSLSSRNSEDV
ncbi:TatD family hydrolase, partial [Patescibacteria group bacterium AH-259-L07]|nr:TatD family hydrolase [Patescibacteria group bacterium AH-259-L07]